MPVLNCPIDGCTYATPDVDAIVDAALITTHATIHNANASPAAIAKLQDKVSHLHLGYRNIAHQPLLLGDPYPPEKDLLA
ncbi:hypothetical protein KP79_PYT25380 [Mizuhopecten yessoensis]|uniref:Uncharacterized protein n=1 Tax=Mizuhopecten yessoensis TaxID=6573 RepID=A0A210R0V2_MIZYE|nr:hypothetical protein KP79_PYT25380 [Mizuhopecten yessoensis]